MNKIDILLNNFSILAKNPYKNAEGLTTTIKQIFEINFKVGINCWQNLLEANEDRLFSVPEDYTYIDDYGHEMLHCSSRPLGDDIIHDIEYELLSNDSFPKALEFFANNSRLLEIVYSNYPISTFFGVYYALAYLIKHGRFNEANNVLTAIYRNKTFNRFNELWRKIIEELRYTDSDHYNSGGWVDDDNLKKSPQASEFCYNWVERIPNEEDHAAALSEILRMFE